MRTKIVRILVIGNGGREAALAWKLSQSEGLEKLFCAPGNPGTSSIAENVPLEPCDIEGLLAFAMKHGIDLTVVGPEKPLSMGIVDRFRGMGLAVFGPTRDCARLETSKIFAKRFMNLHGIPTARHASARYYLQALAELENFELPLVIKADGLAAGKGVFIAERLEEAHQILRDLLIEDSLKEAGSRVVIEEFLNGRELSVFVLSDGKRVVELAEARDFKKAFDGDLGPNTGGMGAISPVPDYTERLREEFRSNILRPTVEGLTKEGLSYTGLLYFGLINTPAGLKVLEFNCRFGDPETQAIMPRIDFDLARVLYDCAKGQLKEERLRLKRECAVTVVACSQGYPGRYMTGCEVSGLSESDCILFQAGTGCSGEKIVTTGGRVLAVTGLESDFCRAKRKAYGALERIRFKGMTFRKDIGVEFDVN
ncbi:MAG: phosphoribosylamine--glycine ligase [Mesotoga sp.]|nr:phosphoribosylamine--glycine ligase [Mesotoga sp.]